MNAYYAADLDHEATLRALEMEQAVEDYIRDMAGEGCLEKCPMWCPFRDTFGLCGYRWPDCKLVKMMEEAI